MDFPIKPSDLPWWGWLLCSVGALVAINLLGRLLVVVMETFEKFGLSFQDEVFLVPLGLIVVLFGGVAVLTGLIGIVRFFKWIWGS